MEQFLEWEERQPTRYELDGSHVTDMNGGTINHQIIIENLFLVLTQHLHGKPCRARLPTQVRTATTVRYPDLVVTCSPQPGTSLHVLDPVILFEVISESTALTDTTSKLDEYTHLPSAYQYVLLSQTEVRAMSYERTGTRWAFSVHRDGMLALPKIDVVLPIAEIYEGVSTAT